VTGDIIKFYNQIFVPATKQYLVQLGESIPTAAPISIRPKDEDKNDKDGKTMHFVTLWNFTLLFPGPTITLEAHHLDKCNRTNVVSALKSIRTAIPFHKANHCTFATFSCYLAFLCL
jgi:hypothetical protein